MIANKLLKCFCVFASLGLTTAKLDAKEINFAGLQKPSFSKSVEKIQPFFDPDFCADFEDMDAFPHPDSCEEYLLCYGGSLWEQSCSVGRLFNPVTLTCDLAHLVECTHDPKPESGCPPSGSDELVFLPSFYCDEYYICINGNAILRSCRPGLHWNMEKGENIKKLIE